MGIEPDQFVYTVPQDCICILCGLVLDEPVEIIACGHRFCLSCFDKFKSRHRTVDEIECPYCGLSVDCGNVRNDKLVWNLIQNFNIFCENKINGCESIYKYGFRDLHSCEYAEKCEDEREKEFSEKCSLCNLRMLDSHDCLKELIKISKLASVQLTNLQHENNRLIGKLTKREKEFLENITLVETQFHEESLKYNKEIRDLKSRLASLQREVGGREHRQTEVEIIHIDLQRMNNTLGFNIIGGATEKDKTSNGIFVSRITDGGAADQPGKLKINDRIIEVEGIDLRSASHDLAVKTFRNSGDPVKMVIQRQNYKSKTCEASTQTFGVMFAVTSDDTRKPIATKTRDIITSFPKPKACRWINPQELINGVHLKTTDNDEQDVVAKSNHVVNGPPEQSESKPTAADDDYDSAYDTLLTQKSSRNSKSLPSSDTESCLITQRLSPQFDTKSSESQPDQSVLMRKNKKNSSTNSENRLSTFYVIPGDEDHVTEEASDLGVDSTNHDEDYEEYEYEEVSMCKSPDEKYGLWLCYGGDDADVSVYVGDIEENSVADASGKIMVGDQIVRINGVHLDNVDEAYRMLQSHNNIVLVVARAVYEPAEYFEDEAEETDLDMINELENEEHPTYLQNAHIANDVIAEVNEDASENAEDVGVLNDNKSTSSSNDSAFVGLQRAKSLSPVTRSPVININNCNDQIRHRSASVNEYYQIEKNMLKYTETNGTSSLPSSPPNKVDKESKYSLKNFVKNKFASHVNDKKEKRPNSQSDDSAELNKLARCDSNSSNSSSRTKKSNSKDSKVEKEENDVSKAAKIKEQRHLSRMKAYLDSPSVIRHRINNNMIVQPIPTKVSSHSEGSPFVINNANTVNYPQSTTINHHPSVKSQSSNSINKSNRHNTPNQKYDKHPSQSFNEQLRSAMKPLNGKSKNSKHVQIDAHSHWNETERRVWEEFKIIQSMEAKENNAAAASLPIYPENCSKVEAEWRVRRSKDGKHIYIKKTNSSRNRILKEREEQIQQERCGMTTDDDAFTIYQGRYWDKEQRKRQLGRHNDRRKKLLQKAIAKQAYENKTEKVLNEMAQRNMFLPGSTVFDNFITVEEILSQRNRCGLLNGPVHVTTI